MPFDSNRVFCQLCWSRPKSILWANPCSEHNCYLRSKVRNGVNFKSKLIRRRGGTSVFILAFRRQTSAEEPRVNVHLCGRLASEKQLRPRIEQDVKVKSVSNIAKELD